MEFCVPSLDRLIRPGDLVFFRGRGWKSRLITLGTGPFWFRGFSHVGFVSYVTGYRHICLVDATTLDDVPCVITGKTSGVRARPLESQLAAYDGEVTVCPINTAFPGIINYEARNYTDGQLGKEYDTVGALHSRGSFVCGLLWKLGKLKESRDALFCSELAGNWLLVAGLMEHDNVSSLNPTSLAIEGEKQGAFDTPWRCE